MTDYICRKCAVDLGIKRISPKVWVGVGHCPYCEETHAIFKVAPGQLDPDPGIGSSDGISRAVYNDEMEV